MPEHDYRDDDLFNSETHHESSDVPVRPLWWAMGIFIVFAIATHIVLGLLYKGLATAERNRMDPPETAIARRADADVPKNQPLLQPFPRKDAKGNEVPPQTTTPVADMIAMRNAEKRQLDNYGWVDRQRGTVHIPIENAKALLAARLAVEGQLGTAAAVTSTAAPGAATSTAPPVVPPVTVPAVAVPPAGARVPAATNASRAAASAGGAQQ